MDAESDLRALVERYATAVDARDFDRLADVFVADGVLVTPTGERAGLDAIQAAMQSLHRYDSTDHIVGGSTVEIDGSTAAGQVDCVAHHYTDGGATDRVMQITYHDTMYQPDHWVPVGEVQPGATDSTCASTELQPPTASYT